MQGLKHALMTITSTTLTAASLLTLATLSAHAWTPGVGNESDTTGLSVDTQSRNDVISFWNCVYMESENFENLSTSSQEFKDVEQRRINYYRAMAGMTASIDLTSTSLISRAAPNAAAQPPSSICLLYTSPSPRDKRQYRMPSSA